MSKKPHHMHALTKASAKHLHAMGHIPAAHRDKIIKSADRGMKAARQPMPMPAPTQGPPQPPGLGLMPGAGGGDMGDME